MTRIMEFLEDSTNFYIALSTSAVTFVITYYYYAVAQKPKIHTSNEKLKNFLEEHVPTLREKFYPNFFIWNGALQSILGLKLRLPNTHKLPYVREILKLKDGGELGLDFLEPENVKEDALVTFILPGLTSSSQTCYVKTIVLSVIKTGSIAVVLNNRGLGGVNVKTPRMYSASNYDDVQEVIGYLKEKYPTNKRVAIGTSMGGMVLCKYISHQPEEAKNCLTTALVISACWDAYAGIQSLEQPLINKYIINSGMTQNLQHLARKYRKVLEVRECFDFDKILGCKTLRDFDSSFTAPQFGFKSVLEYYQDATNIKAIEKFPIPVFSLNSDDDPMSPGHSLPQQEAEAPLSKFVLIRTKKGGHLGYIEGYVPKSKPFHYMERFIEDWVRAVQENSHKLEV